MIQHVIRAEKKNLTKISIDVEEALNFNFYYQVFFYKRRCLKVLICHRAGEGVGIYVSRLDRVIYKVITPWGKKRGGE